MKGLPFLTFGVLLLKATSSLNPLTECLFQTVDTNNDGNLSEKELLKTLYEQSTWTEWALLKTLGGPAYIRKHCDVNHDGLLTKSDLEAKDSCLQTSALRQRLQTILACPSTQRLE
jgi:hypothetical protein